MKKNLKRIFFCIILLGIFLLGQNVALAEYSLPASRVVTWQGNVGVSGGIPTNITQCGSTITSTGDTTNRTTTIQNAINACGSGQYVLLGPGQFTFTGLNMKSNVTLRGSGMGVTILNTSSNESIGYGAYGISYGTAINLASGYTKGSTTITTTSNHGWSAGDYVVIDQLNNAVGDPPITNAGEGGDMTMSGRTGDGSRAMQQVVKLVAPTSGTTATFEIPLYMDFDATKTPQAAKVTMAVVNAGIEHLTIKTSSVYNIVMFNAANCWLNNVELETTHTTAFGVYLAATYRITIHGCKLHLANGVSAADSYMIISAFTGSATLIENNLIYHSTNPIVLQGGMSGSVIAYNYATDVGQSYYPTAVRYGMGYHGGHHYMNLWEGNVIVGGYFSSDNYWGSNSHNTFFRNRVVADYTKSDQLLNWGAGDNQTYWNLIGNYIGTAGSETAYIADTTPYAPSLTYVYAMPTGATRTTMLRHANYDGYTQGQKWCDTSGEPGCQSGSTDHTLPGSLYYSSKPSWYCNESTWPAVDPAGSTDSARYSKIAAQIRYESGTCTTGASDTTAPAAPTNLVVQ